MHLDVFSREIQQAKQHLAKNARHSLHPEDLSCSLLPLGPQVGCSSLTRVSSYLSAELHVSRFKQCTFPAFPLLHSLMSRFFDISVVAGVAGLHCVTSTVLAHGQPFRSGWAAVYMLWVGVGCLSLWGHCMYWVRELCTREQEVVIPTPFPVCGWRV